MEAAKLVNIRKSNKGKIIGEIQFTDGKKMSIPADAPITESLNNSDCKIMREKGSITHIEAGGKVIYSRKTGASKPNGKTYRKSNYHQKRRNNYFNSSARESKAHAPYNFITLNNKVVQGQERPDFDSYYKQDKDNGLQRYNGYLDCRLETITPLYIRDTYTMEELKAKESDNKEIDNKDNPEFFSPTGKPSIPGSSLRGMIRTLVEIMSWGKFGFYDKDQKLFFRAVADTTAIGNYYRKLMLNQKENYFPNFRAGILKKINNDDYRIYPSKTINETQMYRVNFDNRTRRIADSDIKLEEFSFSNIYFKPTTPEDHTHYDFRRQPYKLKYALVTEISTEPLEGYVEGIIISSGNFANKKHYHWIINMPESTDSYINATSAVKQYDKDENRDERVNLLRYLDNNPDGVPCFYITTETGDKVFGHTGLFRIPYLYNIDDHISTELKNEEIVDIPEAIFGKTSKDIAFASRVFFEDAALESGQNDVYLSEQPMIPKILSTPKPTTFQHYLEQDPNSGKQNLNHWNTKEANIRGNKLYWHQKALNWQFDGDVEKYKKLLTSIRPVKPHTKFKFKIRFENLSEVELGSILYALDLPEGHYHKLGMGKPLGLGSVKMTPKLFLIDRENRYSKLLNDENWNLGIKEVEMQEFKDAFETYILKNINENKPLWELDRMKQLKTMLDWSNTNINGWHKKTEYMSIEPYNEFKTRDVLQKPTEI